MNKPIQTIKADQLRLIEVLRQNRMGGVEQTGRGPGDRAGRSLSEEDPRHHDRRQTTTGDRP